MDTCTSGSVYVGATKRSLNTRIEERKANCRPGQIEKSAVAEHILKNRHYRIQFEDNCWPLQKVISLGSTESNRNSEARREFQQNGGDDED